MLEEKLRDSMFYRNSVRNQMTSVNDKDRQLYLFI
jgi:hypothetical protein